MKTSFIKNKEKILEKLKKEYEKVKNDVEKKWIIRDNATFEYNKMYDKQQELKEIIENIEQTIILERKIENYLKNDKKII